MTEALLALVPEYGLWLVGAATFLSCLALPVPSSMVMLAAGGFAAAGDLSLPGAAASALTGALAGDQAGFAIGRAGGRTFLSRIARHPARAAALARARRLLDRHGDLAVFLTRWLVSPVGPYANFAAGAGDLRWTRFTLWGGIGEAVWVTLYTGAGWAFAGNLEAAADLLSSWLGLVGAATATLVLGLWLRALSHHGHH